MPFLATRDDARDLRDAAIDGIAPESLFVGRGAMGLEVAQFHAVHQPSAAQLRHLLERRRQRRATPVLVVVTYGERRAAIAAQFGEEWLTNQNLDAAQVERICGAALDAPDRHAADALLRAKLGQLDQPVPGLRNAGLFAMHELEHGVPARSDWNASRQAARPLLPLRGRELVERLGFAIERTPWPVEVLRAKGTRLGIAVFLERSDEIEPSNERYDGLSPVSYALAKADAERLEYVVVAAGTVLRVYPVKPGVGTARRGRTETFVELDLALLDDASAGYLTLLASADALVPEGTFSAVLASSKRFAAHLGERLRDRVYQEVMPALARAFVAARRLRGPSRERLQETLEMTLVTLFRLLFVAYAEDKELLPYHTSEAYRDHSLKRMAQRLADEARDAAEYGSGDFYWTEVTQLWKAVDRGNSAWRVPAYNGGLFASGEHASAVGRLLGDVSLPDRAFVPALRALLLDETAEAVLGPVDFRALGVREFGTIYEGLLEQELSVAEQELAVDTNGAYVPVRATARRGRERATRGASGAAEPVVREGDVYLHDKSGARKSSGAYYTKDFAVEHLLERALEPALAEHLARLDATYDAREAADRFFDFHVADIAMGSGHFLVAAVDHLERGLSGYLAKRTLPAVRDELERLRRTALDALGDDWRGDPIEDTQLLRRQIARRCVHGVDLNPLAVELARLSLWIHTFVPGLPLSFLDANLVVGNALVGIATFDEARELIGAEANDLFAFTAEDLLARAREPVARLAKLAEATAAEVKDARKLYAKTREEVRATDELFTVLAASRVDDEVREAVEQRQVTTRLKKGDLFSDRMLRKADAALDGLRPLHFPTAFPQVFLRRERPGFDVIMGNPPWQEATVEELAFWARHEPGLRGVNRREQGERVRALRRARPDLVPLYEQELAEAERLRSVLTAGPYPGMGTGDPDLYKAFSWRFWSLVCRDGGRFGVVLPRSAFAAKGSADFRRELFQGARDVDLTMLLNTAGWVFDEAEHRYTIAFAAITRVANPPDEGADVALDGPYASNVAYSRGLTRVAERPRFRGVDVRTWNDTSSLPLLPGPGSANVFLKLRRSPRLDLDNKISWRARPYAELHATNDADLMDLASERRPRGFWPVYKGESFDIWTADTGGYYGWADPAVVVPALQEKRERAARIVGAPFAEFPGEWIRQRRTLPCHHARIAFRDVSRATDTRTVRVALLPPKVVLTNKAPYLLWPRGDRRDEAFLLGVLSSLALDWYARRFVEVSLNYFVFNPFPVPRPSQDSSVGARVITLASRLAVQNDDRFEEWGAAVGVEPAPIAPDEKDDMIHELDASVAHLYGLEERELVHIFETFHEGWDYDERLTATLTYFRRLAAH
jgi:hypothetical protein